MYELCPFKKKATVARDICLNFGHVKCKVLRFNVKTSSKTS